MPFAGVVVEKSVDAGQFVATGQRIARVYGTRTVEVRVPLRAEQLRWFDIPTDGAGPAAIVRSTSGGSHTWSGRVVRQEAVVDQASRMVHVVIEVERPYDNASGRPALRPGSFVEVEIEGEVLSEVALVPRYAVHEGDTIWVIEDGRLRIRDVVVTRTDREHALIGSGLEAGDLVVATSLDAVTDGMLVRVAGGEGDRGGEG